MTREDLRGSTFAITPKTVEHQANAMMSDFFLRAFLNQPKPLYPVLGQQFNMRVFNGGAATAYAIEGAYLATEHNQKVPKLSFIASVQTSVILSRVAQAALKSENNELGWSATDVFKLIMEALEGEHYLKSFEEVREAWYKKTRQTEFYSGGLAVTALIALQKAKNKGMLLQRVREIKSLPILNV